MGVSPHIDLLVAREKKKHDALHGVSPIKELIAWHLKRVGELEGAITGPKHVTTAVLKAEHAKKMHMLTIDVLREMEGA